MGIVAESFRRAVDGGAQEDDFTVTLESRRDPDRWIQITPEMINMAYPLATEPSEELTRRGFTFPRQVELASWEAGKFATFHHAAEPFDDLVAFVERYAREILRAEPDEETFTTSTE